MNLYVTKPCRRCTKPVLVVTVAGGELVTLEPGHPVYMRESDGEGAAVWLPSVLGDVIAAKHVCIASLHAGANNRQPAGGEVSCS